MFSEYSLAEANKFATERVQLDDTQIITVLGSNNSELKALLQSPLELDTPVSISEVRHALISAYNGSETPELTHKKTVGIFKEMPEQFIELSKLENGNLAVTQTEAGRNQSASLAGHLLNLAVITNTPIRSLVGENVAPRQIGETMTNHTIATRILTLTCLWTAARREWQPYGYLKKSLMERGLKPRTISDHFEKLVGARIIERELDSRRSSGRPDTTKYRYRLLQENGHVPPTETVERYLAVVVLSSTLDPDFIDEGLSHLGKISQTRPYVRYLLRRSSASEGNRGRNL